MEGKYWTATFSGAVAAAGFAYASYIMKDPAPVSQYMGIAIDFFSGGAATSAIYWAFHDK